MENIVFIGMPASGKSTVGKIMSKTFKKLYYDVDKYIEQNEKIKIADFFEKYGEEAFRELETKYIEKISKFRNVIISTGGGAVLKEKNIDILKQNGVIIFLDRKIENILKENHSRRPLLKDTSKVYELYEKRYPLYLKYADYVVMNEENMDETLKKVKKLLNKIYK